jgi:hypothetical protein
MYVLHRLLNKGIRRQNLAPRKRRKGTDMATDNGRSVSAWKKYLVLKTLGRLGSLIRRMIMSLFWKRQKQGRALKCQRDLQEPAETIRVITRRNKDNWDTGG